MPTIPLTQGRRAKVDWCDYRELSRHKWYAQWDRSTNSFYAKRRIRLPNGQRTAEAMHRRIMALEVGDPRQVDHLNHDTLENRRRNLRIVTNRGNAENRRDQSKYGVGVARRTKSFRFRAHVFYGKQRRHLGGFGSREEAREARSRFLQNPEQYRTPSRSNASPWGAGIRKTRSGRFEAFMIVNRKWIQIGTFSEAEEARKARRAFAEALADGQVVVTG